MINDCLSVWLRDLLCSIDNKACFGRVAGACATERCRVGEPGFSCEVYGGDLVGRSAVQHALSSGVVSRVEAAQHLFERTVRVD